MLLIDAGAAPGAAPASLGGTGLVVDWERFVAAGDAGMPVALAGGLTGDNVAAAIEATGATAVDTASGGESTPGRKDPDRVQASSAGPSGRWPPELTADRRAAGWGGKTLFSIPA